MTTENNLNNLVGDRFFHSLTEHLCTTVNADVVYIGEIVNEGKHMRTISVSCSGYPGENFNYELEGTPCRHLPENGIYSYPSNVQEAFPDDFMLLDMAIEGYIGVPLTNQAGDFLGTLVALYHHPVSDPSFVGSQLIRFSLRTAAELERKQVDEKFQESESHFRALVELMQDALVITDISGIVTGVSEPASCLVGLPPLNFIGKPFMELLANDSVQLFLQEFEKLITTAIPRAELELRIHTKNGAVKLVKYHAVVTCKNNVVTGTMGLLHDLSR